MAERKDYDDHVEELYDSHEEELEEDWTDNFDDYDSNFWESHYGGPDDDEIDEYHHQEWLKTGQFEEQVDRMEVVENLIDTYIKIRDNYEDVKAEYDTIRDKISTLLKDDEIIKYHGHEMAISYYKKWNFSDSLQKWVNQIEEMKKVEILQGIAKLNYSSRYVKGKRLQEYTKNTHPRAYAPWSEEEDKSLMENLAKGVSLTKLSEIHKRGKIAIRLRIKKLKEELKRIQ